MQKLRGGGFTAYTSFIDENPEEWILVTKWKTMGWGKGRRLTFKYALLQTESTFFVLDSPSRWYEKFLSIWQYVFFSRKKGAIAGKPYRIDPEAEGRDLTTKNYQVVDYRIPPLVP